MSQALTKVASEWLATLHRRSAPSTEDVRTALARHNVEAFEPWLDFHERFAGYVEPIGYDQAVWGLMHHEPQWLPPNDVVAEHDDTDRCWYAACADVHPTYAYELADSGQLVMGPSRDFVTHIERRALRYAFCAHGTPEVDFNVKAPALVARIENDTHIVEAASDDHFVYRVGGDIFAIYEVTKHRWVEVLHR